MFGRGLGNVEEMKIDYVRKLTTSHMVLEAAGKEAAWEIQMIAHAGGQKILFAEHVRENGIEQLWYDITGKQSLDTLLESEKLGFELLCEILNGIYESVEILEGLLLRADALLLLPECIFADYRTKAIYFCYYPENPKGITERFMPLLEFLLERLDHQDARAVELAYRVYEQAVPAKGEGSFGEWKRLLRTSYERDGAEEMDVAERMDAIDGIEDMENTSKVKCMEDTERFQGGDMAVAPVKKASRLQACMEKVKEQLKGLGKSATERSGLRDTLRMPRASGLIHRKEAEEPFVFEPEEEEETPPVSRPTVLLSELVLPPEGILRYEGTNGKQDLIIGGTSYLIGSGRECDGIIESSTVSRKHARITRKGDVYFMEDLNSSNGTYVGGKMLNYRTKVGLAKNEIVVFADEKFRFI